MAGVSVAMALEQQADTREVLAVVIASLRRTHAPNFQLFDSEQDFARWRQDERRGRSSEEVYAYIRDRGALYGTASVIEETLEAFTDVGCGGFMIFCTAAPAAHALEQLAALPSVHRAINVPTRSAIEELMPAPLA